MHCTGAALEYFRNDANLMRATTSIMSGQLKAPFHNNQFGASLGGPIRKDKTFFYFDYEGQQESRRPVDSACVPDPAQMLADGGATRRRWHAALLARRLAYLPAPNVPGTYGGALVGSEDSGCPNAPDRSVVSPSFSTK